MMYEFNHHNWFDDDWDQGSPETGQAIPIAEGWLIELLCESEPQTRQLQSDCQEPDRFEAPRFLQIGTGQWCSARYATLFPICSAAEVYAKEFGYEVGSHVKIVKQRF